MNRLDTKAAHDALRFILAERQVLNGSLHHRCETSLFSGLFPDVSSRSLSLFYPKGMLSTTQ